MPGFVDPDRAMAEHDVLAMLSVWENCSYALLDAAGRGMGVVASDVGGNPEILPATLAGRRRGPAGRGVDARRPGTRPDAAPRPHRLARRRGHVRADRGDLRHARGLAMSKVDTPWNLPDRTVERADEADREIRMSDFALMALLPRARRSPSPASRSTSSRMAALVVLCLLRPARGGAKLPTRGRPAGRGPARAARLLRARQRHRLDPPRRPRRHHGRASSGRAAPDGSRCARSAPDWPPAWSRSSAWRWSASAATPIPGRLTGFLADPNAGAYFIAVLGPLAIFFCDERTKVRVAVAVPIVAGLVLSYSRTGLLAGAFVARLAGARPTAGPGRPAPCWRPGWCGSSTTSPRA